MSLTKQPMQYTVPEKMRAWVLREERHGSPQDALRLEAIQMPIIGPNEVLVLVRAAGINYNGLWACQGEPLTLSGLRTGYDFHIPGSDASGIVFQVGAAVKCWHPGDEVVLHCNMSCGECAACNGFDPLACKEQKIWGYEANWGSFAPFAKVQAQQLLPKPDHLTWEEAASYVLCLSTAYRMLVTQAHIRAGENVLIWGAAGGLGVYATQLCLLHGANPICVVSSKEKEEFCRSLGATNIIDRTSFDVSTSQGIRELGREIRRLTGGNDPDVVFEHVGQQTFTASVFLCGKFGRIVICGATSGYDVGFDARYLWIRQKSILGSHFANASEATLANNLVIARKVKPILWKTFPFAEVPFAQLEQGQTEHMGKLAALVTAETIGQGRRF